MYSKKFQINKKMLREEFYSDLNKIKRIWFFENFSSEARQKIQDKYYEFLSQKKDHICSLHGLKIIQPKT